jgi:sugar phosphate isomerase/epimerase
MVKQIQLVSDLHYRRSIEMALELRARYLVFHTQWTPIYTVAECYDPWADSLATYFQEVVDTMGCANAGLTLVLENFMEPKPSLHLGVLERIDRPEVRACLDVGHTNLFSSLSPIAWFDALRPYLVTLHLHNNSGLLDQHNGLANGSLAMADFLAHVSQSQAAVQLMLEVTGEQAVEESLAFINPYQQARQTEWLAKTFIL